MSAAVLPCAFCNTQKLPMLSPMSTIEGYRLCNTTYIRGTIPRDRNSAIVRSCSRTSILSRVSSSIRIASSQSFLWGSESTFAASTGGIPGRPELPVPGGKNYYIYPYPCLYPLPGYLRLGRALSARLKVVRRPECEEKRPSVHARQSWRILLAR